MKKFLFVLTCLIYGFVTAAGAAASENVNVIADERAQVFDVAPQNTNVRILVPVLTIVPIKFVSEAFWETMKWRGPNNTAYITPKDKEPDAIRFNRDYEQVGENNIFVYRSAEEIIDILEKGTGVVYLGFPSCPWCQVYTPILNEVATDAGINEIFYLNIREIRQQNTDEYKKIVSILEQYLELDAAGAPRIYVPDITVVKNGEIVGHDNETSTISGEITPDEYWTKDKKDALRHKLKSMLMKIY